MSLEVHHAVDFQLPIGCAGVAVFPGDVMVGDQEGVVVIPRHLARAVAEEGQPWSDTESTAGSVSLNREYVERWTRVRRLGSPGVRG